MGKKGNSYLKQLEKKVEKLTETMKDKDNEIINLKKKNDNLEKKNDNLKKKNDNLKKKNDNLEKKNDNLEKEKKELIFYGEYEKNFKYCEEELYKKFDLIQKQIKRRKIKRKRRNKIIRYKKIKNIFSQIKDIKKTKKKIQYNKNDKIIHISIGDEMSDEKFFQSLKDAIKRINNNWNENDIKNLNDELSEIDFSFIHLNSNSPLTNLKKELLIDIVLQEKYEENSKDFRMLRIKNSTKIPIIKGIPFKIKEEYVYFNKEFIIDKILGNIGIINAFYRTIQNFTPIGRMDLNDLKKKITEMINNTNIYFCDLPNDIYGLTIYNGDIFIRGDFLKEALGETKDYKQLNQTKQPFYILTAIAKIYFTLLHEFAHKLHYILRNEKGDEDWMQNFFDHSQTLKEDNYKFYEFISLNQNIQSKKTSKNTKKNESGDFFEEELYLGTTLLEITEEMCNFFLNDKCDNYKEYIQKMKNIKINLNKKNKKRSSNAKYRCISKNFFSRCFFSVKRNSS